MGELPKTEDEEAGQGHPPPTLSWQEGYSLASREKRKRFISKHHRNNLCNRFELGCFNITSCHVEWKQKKLILLGVDMAFLLA